MHAEGFTCPLLCAQRTQVGHRAISEKCQWQTSKRYSLALVGLADRHCNRLQSLVASFFGSNICDQNICEI
jgi:hypothetical protein